MTHKTKVAGLHELEPGSMKQVRVLGRVLLLVNLDGKFFAVDDTCTHAGCSLSRGYLDVNAVVCACHGAQFDVMNGKVLSGPAPSSLNSYKVNVEGDDVYIEW